MNLDLLCVEKTQNKKAVSNTFIVTANNNNNYSNSSNSNNNKNKMCYNHCMSLHDAIAVICYFLVT